MRSHQYERASRRYPEKTSNTHHSVHKLDIDLEVLTLEFWHVSPHVILWNIRFFLVFSSEETPTERTVITVTSEKEAWLTSGNTHEYATNAMSSSSHAFNTFQVSSSIAQRETSISTAAIGATAAARRTADSAISERPMYCGRKVCQLGSVSWRERKDMFKRTLKNPSSRRVSMLFMISSMVLFAEKNEKNMGP